MVRHEFRGAFPSPNLGPAREQGSLPLHSKYFTAKDTGEPLLHSKYFTAKDTGEPSRTFQLLYRKGCREAMHYGMPC